MENRNGLIVHARLTEATGTAERTTALDMIEDNAKRGSTLGADKNYNTTLSPVAASAAARRMSRRTIPTAARRLTRARHGIPAIASARSSASGSKNHSRGSRQSAVCARPGTVAAAWFSGSSCSAPQPTISFVFRRCWQQRDESVWSVKHATKLDRKLRAQRRLWPIDRLILAAHIRRIALQDYFSAAC